MSCTYAAKLHEDMGAAEVPSSILLLLVLNLLSSLFKCYSLALSPLFAILCATLWRITGWFWGSPAAKVNVWFVTALFVVTLQLSCLLEQMVFSSLRRA